MPRLARRLHPDTPPPPPSRSLPIRAIWRWAQPALALAVASGLVLWLERSTVWSTLRSSVQSLDFDPNRASLILAWLGALALAAGREQDRVAFHFEVHRWVAEGEELMTGPDSGKACGPLSCGETIPEGFHGLVEPEIDFG